MPRKSITELTEQAIADFPDNVTGLITPAKLRGFCEDFLNAIRPAYGVLQKTAPQTVNLGTTPSLITYSSTSNSDPGQTTSSLPNGSITRSERGTSTINFTMDVEVSNTRIITFTLFKNGAATPWRISVNGAGAGNPVGAALTAVDYADPAASYDVRASADAASTSTVLDNGSFVLSIDPVNSYA